MNVICFDKSLCFVSTLSTFSSSGSSFIGSLLKSSLGLASLIEIKGGVLLSNWLDQLLSGKILDQSSRDGTSNLELFTENGSSNAEDLWDLLEHSLVLLLIQEYGVVKLLLYLGLGPGLLLGFSSTFTGSGFL